MSHFTQTLFSTRGGYMLRRFSLLTAAAVAGTACGSAPAIDQAPDQAAIAAATTATQAAENAGSVERMRAYFADDLIMLAPNMPAVAGAEAVAEAMQQFFDAFALDVTYTSEEVVTVGDWGFDRGTYRNRLTPKAGGAPVTETGKYLWIYRKAPDGSWKQSRVMWNSSDAAPPAGS